MSKPIKIFLDDTRIPSDIYGDNADSEWMLTCDPETVKECLLEGGVTHLSLNNDLGPDYAEGHTLIPWMMENNVWPTEELWVHSANLYWSSLMQQDIKRYYYSCVKPQRERERREAEKNRNTMSGK